MRILLIGGGGREHAIACAIAQSEHELYAVMSNKNPGICRLSREYLISSEKDFSKIGEWVKNKKIDLAVIGPEAPLQAGIVEFLDDLGIKCASPTSSAARIETSKIYMRELMQKYDIPGNVKFKIFDAPEDLKDFDFDKKIVVKPEGLTGGKGVKVMGEHFQTLDQGIEYAREVISKKIGGTNRVLIEQMMEGEEFTLQAFSDGCTLKFMPVVQDFKRAWEGDLGPNTGGMGSYSTESHSLPFLDGADLVKSKEIMYKILDAMKNSGNVFKGIMYGQFMLTFQGPVVIEINSRFGDPEAMNVLSILKTDMGKILNAIVLGTLDDLNIEFESKATVVKYIVPEGYGTVPVTDQTIDINEEALKKENLLVYYANVNEKNGAIFTTSSRAVGIVGVADNVCNAERNVEKGLKYVNGRIYVRHDIASSELINKKIEKMKKIKAQSSRN